MEQIGQYLVVRLVGEGGMGKVFEAEERLSKRRVALKVLKPELARSEEGRRLFLNEMTILSQLDHKNVVRCLASSEIDGQLVMTLEYLEGKTLREYLTERGALGWSEALSIAVQVLAALEVAHQQAPPVVHRDLKPENIMVLADGSVKVMDFGIAKVLEVMHKTTTQSVGTLQYMSPEQIDATGVDARSDLYCLGLVLYEMLSGRPPFDSASPRQLLNQQCTEPPPPLPEDVRLVLPRGVERLLFALLEKLPDARPQNAREVLAELEPFTPQSSTGHRSSELGRSKTRAAVSEPGRPAAEPGRPAASGAVRSEVSAKTPEPQSRRRVQDTIELLERRPNLAEVSTRMAWTAIVGLSIAAGIATYWFKSSRVVPAPEPVTASTELPAPSQD